MKRTHQTEMERACDEIEQGSPIKKIILHVTPGGGKSAIPIIAGSLITAGLADALCWITPRKALQDQGERNFLDPFFRKMFDHTLTIRSSTNEINPCRGQNGFVSTYQALSMDSQRMMLGDFRKKRYILILDEFHHVEKGGIWHNDLYPLVEKSKYLVLMTGTLERGNGARIAYTPYTTVPGGEIRPEIRDTFDTRVIKYGRAQALKEKAILPLKFFLSDAYVEWEEAGGKREAQLRESDGHSRKALFTALETEFAESLLDAGVNDWLEYKTCHPRAQLLIVTASIDHAHRFKKALGFGLESKARIATSDDTPDAMEAIKAFKAREVAILICVAMCYEGLDCPSITHLICLTHIRSTPWIEQMVARLVRIDRPAGPYESQVGYVFAPDDPLFQEVVNQIKREQLPIVSDPSTSNEGEKKETDGEGSWGPNITPIGSVMAAAVREMTIGIPDGTALGPDPEPVEEILVAAIKTIKEIEDGLRTEIKNHVSSFSFSNRYKPQRINGEIKAHFGKPRDEMTAKELEVVMAFLKNAYPLVGRSGYPGVSQTRGKHERVPTKPVPWP